MMGQRSRVEHGVVQPIFGLFLVLLFASEAFAATDSAWKPVLDRVANSVVALQVSSTRAFDTSGASSSRATGFVVDAERGIIMTNRHVVTPGPVVAEAVFRNHEEVAVRPIYRDPVHDFGFYQYDPKKTKLFEKPEALLLRPKHAAVGLEIHVVGNDAGEKLSFLPGKLARLDRDAPRYGRGGYNDFNTFYYQAASGTSGGSSGSPVVDAHGHVVALNAGGSSRAQSSFYLPLNRVVRALKLIQEGKPVSRGTLQTVLQYQHYDELRRLGLRAETESAARRVAPNRTGLLVVAQTVPGGPAFGILEPGDILLRVQGKRVTEFIPLEAILDTHVGRSIELEIERGGENRKVEIVVQDLHSITPDTYLEMGEAIFNEISYQQARNYGIPAKGVYVSLRGYMLRSGPPQGSVITMVGGVPTPNLERFEEELSKYADGTELPMGYFRVNDPQNYGVALISVDRRWFDMQRCVRNDSTGLWPCTVSAEPTEQLEEKRVESLRLDWGDKKGLPSSTPTMVMVEYYIPYRVEGVHGDRFWGAGIVVDAEKGLIAVDRDTIPTSLGDVKLTFGGSLELPGQVVYLHPEHNLAVVSYDPALLGDTEVRGAKFKIAPLDPGTKLKLAGLTSTHKVISKKTKVSRLETFFLPYTHPPRFREKNLEAVDIDSEPSVLGGVLMDRRGRVLALWSSFSREGRKGDDSFFAGLPASIAKPVIDALREGGPVVWRSLGVELRPITLARARNFGLSSEAAATIEEFDPMRRRVLAVHRLAVGFPAAKLFREGDLLLSIDGKPVTSFRAFEEASQLERVTIKVSRYGREVEFEAETLELDGKGLDRALVWAGALLHEPHLAVAAQEGIPREGAYVAYRWHGSPADRYRVKATERIVEVDGVPTLDLDSFLEAVKGKPDRDSVRVKVIDLDGIPRVTTLKLDLQYWPTAELRRNGRGWERISLEPTSASR